MARSTGRGNPPRLGETPDRTDADVVIVGAGAAGLSCAARISAAGLTRKLRILLLEPRTEYIHDRTWCFWNVLPNPFDDCVSHRWTSWSVAGPTGRIERSSPGLTYDHLPADAFYDRALDILASDPNVELRPGVRVERLEPAGKTVRVISDAGEVATRIVLDSRPRRIDAPASGGSGDSGGAAPRLIQHFHGETIRTESDVFDPAVATVMDFRVSQEDGIHFVYVLPFDRRAALVEDTYFAGRPAPLDTYVERIADYVQVRYGVDRYEVLHSETGAIPMDSRPLPPSGNPRIIDIGVRGGAARPSTGYAFLAIQRQAARLAGLLARWADDPSDDPPRPPPSYSSRSAFLDRVFLAHLVRHPGRAPELFLRLFEHVPPDALARFLFDGGSWADDLRVMSALPAAPLVAAAWNQYVRRRPAEPEPQ